MRSFVSAWIVTIAASWMLVVAGCAPDPRPRVLTEPCDHTDECESGLECVAGRCTAACAGTMFGECSELGPSAPGIWPTACSDSFCEIPCDPAPEFAACPELSQCVPGPGVSHYCRPAP